MNVVKELRCRACNSDRMNGSEADGFSCAACGRRTVVWVAPAPVPPPKPRRRRTAPVKGTVVAPAKKRRPRRTPPAEGVA